jgi:hypothetical protein
MSAEFLQAFAALLNAFHASPRVVFHALRALCTLDLNAFHAVFTAVLTSFVLVFPYAAESAVARAVYAAFTAAENVVQSAPSADSLVATAVFTQLVASVLDAVVSAEATSGSPASNMAPSALIAANLLIIYFL